MAFNLLSVRGTSKKCGCKFIWCYCMRNGVFKGLNSTLVNETIATINGTLKSSSQNPPFVKWLGFGEVLGHSIVLTKSIGRLTQ